MAFIEATINMEIQTTTLNQQSSAPRRIQLASVAFPALLRLALLIAPLTLAVMIFSQSPFFCVLVCLAVFAVWLTVDVGPFRASSVPREESRRVALPSARNLTRFQWWNGLFCRVLIFSAMFYSKLHI
jgi:hypothetical protein